MGKISEVHYVKWLVSFVALFIFGIVLSPGAVYSSDEVEEVTGSMLDFYAHFPESEIEWGKAPFDKTSGNGMDKSPRDPIVRTFDSATYNLNITANPTIEGSVDNVIIRVWGELDGAISDDGRVNAVYSSRNPGEVFTVLNPEESDYYDEAVSGVDFTYTLDRVGEAVSLPIDISVQGAHNEAKITPQLQIQVIEVDGKDVTNEEIRVDLRNQLLGFSVTAQVSFEARLRNVVGGQLDLTTARGALDDPEEHGWYRPIGSDFVLQSLPERSNNDMRGATFPSGKIYFDYEIYGLVDYWENGTVNYDTNRFPMDFVQEGDQPEIAHHGDIDGAGRKTFNGGVEGLRWEDKTFSVVNFSSYNTGRSRMPNFKQETIESNYTYSVWDSGIWKIEPFRIEQRDRSELSWTTAGWDKQQVLIHSASIEDYTIGYTFPTRRSNGANSWLLQSGDRTIYDGLDMDPHTSGGTSGGMGSPVFATQTHTLYMPNSYRHGSPSNAENLNNEEAYRFHIKVTGYEDENGNLIEIDTPTWRNHHNFIDTILDNRGGGSITVNQQLRGSNMREEDGQLINPTSNYSISNEVSGYTVISTGDSQLIQGNNAFIHSILRISRPSRGGLDHVHRWNTDTFEVTPLLADYIEVENINRGYWSIDGRSIQGEAAKEHLSTLWGVPNFEDNSFESFMGRGQEDYKWYDDFREAASNGPVGARMIRVTDGVPSGDTIRGVFMPLFVHDQTLGSVNEKGTPHIVSSQGYVYFNGREREPTRSNYSYQSKGNFNWLNGSRNYTTYTNDFTIDQIQNPIGENTPLATLAIVPGSARGTLRSEKTSLYSNETTRWIGTTTLTLPDQYGDSNEATLAPYMTVEHTLPRGLRYVAGSGEVREQSLDPSVTINEDGTQTLLWRMRLDQYMSADFTFDTTVNPFGLSGNSSERLEIIQDVRHDLDQDMHSNRVNLRQARSGVNILRIGLVGVHGELNPTNGSANEHYTYRLRPYTTMQDEHGVKGVFTLPYDGDSLGSKFSGTLSVADITVTGRDDVMVWIHRDSLNISRPDQVNLDDGWEVWNDQSNVGTIYFEIEEYISAQDTIEIAIDLSPEGNRIGDSYVHQASINSNQGYIVSPVTERERFRITPDGEIGLEYIRIDTNNASEGLIAEIGFSSLIYREAAENESFAIELHEVNSDKESVRRVASWNTTFEELSRSNESIELSIPTEYLDVNQSKRYEASLTSYKPDRIQIVNEADRIDTLGYTSSELDIAFDTRDYDQWFLDDPTNWKAWTYENVVRTERYLGNEMQEYFESWTVIPKILDNTKSGYGIEWSQDLVYRNELGVDNQYIEASIFVDEDYLDGNFDVTQKDNRSLKEVNLQHAEPEEVLDESSIFDDELSFRQRYLLPMAYVEDETGDIYTEREREDQAEARGIGNQLFEAGRKLFTPIWVPELGTQDILFSTHSNDERLGVNDIHIEVWSDFNISAWMYGHVGSETLNEDEIIISPVDPSSSDIPSNFNEDDRKWIQGNLIEE